MQPQKNLSGYIMAILATAIWSGNFVIARGLSDSIPPVTLAFGRWLVAVIAIAPFAVKSMVKDWHHVKDNIGYLVVTSFLGITIFNTLIYFAGHTTSAINLSLISITFPIFVILLSRFIFKEYLTVNRFLGIILVVAGVVILITKGDLKVLWQVEFAIGDLWMLLAAMIFAVYSILVKQKPKEMGIMGFQLITFLLGLIFLLPFFIWEQSVTPFVKFDTTSVLSILYVGIFASLTAFVLWNKAIDAIGPSRSGMIYYTLPLFSGLVAFLFIGEKIGFIHLISALLIVPGIIIANRKKSMNRTGLKEKE